MANITVALTDTQTKSLEYAAYSVQEWCDNVIHNRARLAQEEIIAALVAHCNANDVAIATGVDAQITQAYSLNIVATAKSIQDAASSPA